LLLLGVMVFIGMPAPANDWPGSAQAAPRSKSAEQTAILRPSGDSRRTGDRSISEIPPAAQDLGWRLVGTAVTDDPRTSFAIIEVKSTGRQGACREGDRVGDIEIKKILPGEVIIVTQMGEQMLSMGSGGNRGTAQLHSETPRLDRKEVEATLPEYMQLMREIRVRPHLEAGRPDGILIYNIDPGSIFARMGLENGDVLVDVNGKRVTSTQQTVELYNALKRGGVVSLKIKRGETKRELNFEIH
jgi:general secretion pathway protein C